MKNLKSTKPLTVSTIDRAYTYVLANDAISNGHYTVLAIAVYIALRKLFVLGANDVTLSVALTDMVVYDNYNVIKITSPTYGNGVAFGCMKFSRNNLHKIAKFVGFSKTDLLVFFPKTIAKAKAARAGR